jgi:hypothetical protein
MDLKDLLDDPHSTSHLRYLPHTYATELDDKNPKCAPNCPKQKIYQDPMTGKEWTIIRGTAGNATTGQVATVSTGSQGGAIIGVASKSEDEPLKTDFKDTALEKMGSVGSGTTPNTPGAANTSVGTEIATPLPGLGGKMTKYSEWKFIADTANDHAKIYRAYHEGW